MQGTKLSVVTLSLRRHLSDSETRPLVIMDTSICTKASRAGLAAQGMDEVQLVRTYWLLTMA